MEFLRAALLLMAAGGLVPGAADPARSRQIRELAKGGADSIPGLREFLKDPDAEIRVDAVKALVEIGTQRSLDPLMQATLDNDAEVQARATDGLVNFYLPGYVRTGFTASLRRVGGGIKGKFTDTSDQMIDPYVKVRPEVIAALGKLARGGVSMEVRANAARAVGILRGGAAAADLVEAVRGSKDSLVIYESLVAFQKIRDPSVAPKISFLLRDLDPKVQVAAIETTGLLQNKEALPDLLEALNRARDRRVERAALTAIAMLPEERNRDLYTRYLASKDDRLRGAAAEGLARLKNPADAPALERALEEERKTSARLSMAFALVMLGKNELSEFSPLQFLVNTCNSTAFRGEAYALLVELARNPATLSLLYQALERGTKDEKVYLARVLAASGDPGSLPHLDRMSRDPDREVAAEGLRALRALKARL